MHFLDVGDHADAAAQGLQAVERLHGQGQGLRVEAAEPFIDEQRFDGQFAGGHGGQSQRQGQRDEEGLAAGERVHRATLVAHVMIDHQQAQLAAAAHQAVAAAEPLQVSVGMFQQLLQVVGLGDASEDLAIGGADQLADAAPAAIFVACCLELGLAGLLSLAATIVVVQGVGSVIAGRLRGVVPGRQLLPSVVESKPAAGDLRLGGIAKQRRLVSVLGDEFLVAAMGDQGLAALGESGFGALSGSLGFFELTFLTLDLVLGLRQ